MRTVQLGGYLSYTGRVANIVAEAAPTHARYSAKRRRAASASATASPTISSRMASRRLGLDHDRCKEWCGRMEDEENISA
jgi:hypothetical protein